MRELERYKDCQGCNDNSIDEQGNESSSRKPFFNITIYELLDKAIPRQGCYEAKSRG